MMRLTITLRPETEAALKAKADAQGKPMDVYAASLIDTVLVAPDEAAIQNKTEKNQAAINALESFMDGDEAEQREALEFLKKAIDEDRPGQRSIFGTGYNPS